MRGLKQGMIGLAFVGGAAVPGGAWALASFDTSAEIIFGIGQSMGKYNGSPIPDPAFADGSLDPGDIFNNTGLAGETAFDDFGGPAPLPDGLTVTTTPRDGVAVAPTETSTSSWSFDPDDPSPTVGNPSGLFKDFPNDDVEMPTTLAEGQKVQITGQASNGGALGVRLNNVSSGSQTHQVSFDIVNPSDTEALSLDFVAIPNLLVDVFSDKVGDDVSVRSAVNLGFINMIMGDVTYILERGLPDIYTAEMQQVTDTITAVSFAQNASIIDGVFSDELGVGQQPVPAFAWSKATIAPGATGTLLIEFVMRADLTSTEDSSPVPVPAALPLLGAAIAGLGFAAHRRRRRVA